MSILVLTSDTLIGTPATGNLEYNGQFYGTDSNASRAQMQRITQGTAVAYTSFTTTTYNDFLNIPSWAKRITVMLTGVSTSGTNSPQVQIGSGSVLTSGYTGIYSTLTNAASVVSGSLSAGFRAGIYSTNTETNSGAFTLSLLGSNIWICNAQVANSSGYNSMGICAGTVTLSGALDRVRFTTVGSTDTFDAGSINILYGG